MSTLNVTTIQSNTASTPPVINDSAGTQIGTFCRAWVNFNGTGTVAIQASFNVSSVTDGGVGVYTVNFTTAMPDANYSIAGACNDNINAAANLIVLYPASGGGSGPTNLAVTIGTVNTSSGAIDLSSISLNVFTLL